MGNQRVPTKTNTKDSVAGPADNKPSTKAKANQKTQVSLETKQSTRSGPQGENFENIDEAEFPTLGDISSSTITQPRTMSQEENIAIPETNQHSETIQTTSRNSSQMESTRDESQDPLLGELVIITQTNIDEETINQEQEPVEETKITITAIIEEINRSMSSKNSSLHEETRAVNTMEENKAAETNEQNSEMIDQSTREELQHSLLGETSNHQAKPRVETQPSKNIESMMDEAMLQTSSSNDLITPREEFTLIDDPDSLEEIVIYDMIVEHQAPSIVTINKNIDDDVIEIKAEPQENNSEDAIKQSISRSQAEIMTDSQIIVDHEEITSTQEPILDQPPEEPEDWEAILLRSKIPEGCGRHGIHEEDMAIITRDRPNNIPTNRDCISNIYGYYENDNPAIPTEIYYRWCKPETTIEGMHRRENFRIKRRRNLMVRP